MTPRRLSMNSPWMFNDDEGNMGRYDVVAMLWKGTQQGKSTHKSLRT